MGKSRSKKKVKKPERGDPIEIIGGEYEGRSGWIDKAREQTDCMTYVIVKFEDGEVTDYPIRIYTANVSKNPKPPKTYLEHGLKQHPDLTKLMRKLCKGLAELDLDPKAKDEAVALFSKKLDSAIKSNHGRKGRSRKITFIHPN